MKMAIAFWCTLVTVAWSQEEARPTQSLEQLLAQVESAEDSERVIAFRALLQFWSLRLEHARGFSDTPLRETKLKPEPRISEEELGSVAQAIEKGSQD
ncbi:MAG: hypothetical protein AAF394_07640, partial [Planctomycetota bacterium]